MSASIGIFKGSGTMYESDGLHLQAFVGGKGGKSIQFTIDCKYCCLSEKQLRTLQAIISRRLDGDISATGHDWDYVIGRDGSLIEDGDK